MALKVWLPLNKNLRNVGLDNVSLTNYGVSLSDDGVFVKSHKFNGTSNYFQFDNLNIDSKRYLSLTFWCYSVEGNLYGIFTCRNTSGNHQFSLLQTGLGFRDTNHSSWTTFSFEQPSANVWTHYAIIYSDGTWIVYKNGNKIYEQSYGSATLNANINEIRVGRYKSSSQDKYFNGKLNDFRIYDHALTEEDVNRICQKKIFDLVPYSGIKNVLFDRSGLMIGNVVPYNLTYRPMCAYFNGSTSAIQIPPMTSMNDSGIFSMNVWFYKDGFGSERWETIFGGPSGFELEMKPRAENTPRIVAYSWGQTSATGITYATKQWNMLTMTRTTSNSKFYLNGELKYTGNAASIPSGDYWVGSWKVYDSQNYKGLVSNFQLYRKELTAEEILKLYNEERNMFLPDEYEELEYIQSDGNQYIDTGLKANLNTKAECVYKFYEYDTTNKLGNMFGCRSGQHIKAFVFGTGDGFINSTSNLFSQFDTVAHTTVTSKSADLQKHIVTLSKNGFYIDNVLLRTFTNPTDFTSDYNILLFAYYNQGVPNKGKLIVYSFKLYQDDIMIQNLIPAKRKSDNVIGMYDMVTRQFFTNAGSGSFTGA